MKDQEQTNSITRKVAGLEDQIQKPLFLGGPSPHKSKQLDKLAAMAIYYGGRPLSLYKDNTMKELFIDGIG